MPIFRTDRNQTFDGSGNLLAEQVVQVDVTDVHTLEAIKAAFAAAKAALAADRQAYLDAIAAVNAAKQDVAAHVANIEAIRDSTGTLTNAQRDGALRQLAAAMRDHFTASNRLSDSQIVLAQATDELRLTVHRMAKLLLVLHGESRETVLADDPDDPLVVT